MHWYFPSWNGDVRIESDAEDPRRTVLTVIEPTAHELELLDRANSVFKAKKWVHGSSKLWKLSGDQQRQQTTLDASLLEVGLILVGRLKPGLATLTAVTTEEDTVEAMGTSESGFIAWIGKQLHGDVGFTPAKVNFRDEEGYAKFQLAKKEEAKLKASAAEREEREKKEAEEREALGEVEAKAEAEDSKRKKREEEKARKAKEEKKKKKAATTVKRPTTCCPESIPGVIEPAQEVLLQFCDAEQREQWLRERRLVARGGLTGHRYLIAHRHTDTAIKMGKCSWDLDDDAVMHFHDWTVPPEEEVLAAKLILEHREPWLRNEATCLGGHGQRFKNPFGNGGDGTHDAGFTSAMGQYFRALEQLDRYRS